MNILPFVDDLFLIHEMQLAKLNVLGQRWCSKWRLWAYCNLSSGKLQECRRYMNIKHQRNNKNQNRDKSALVSLCIQKFPWFPCNRNSASRTTSWAAESN